jgi:aarF domain-containing kinase
MMFVNVGLIMLVLFFVLLLDYEYSLWGIPEGSSKREKIKHEVHLRSAQRLRDLCFKNGGIYIKLGQHLGQLVYFAFTCVVF